ncbi:unnamed protein product (macronuclear) [Paramecium tetraurelia]|uniref:Protein kinase domain-containing protein n=1 Tax=Paramecium tetraurelia TaxID=5888 RepID=A0BIC5_PARTE|nr:uncharacterized protein GSPATT00004664001 [Paramecium tetraurelia]CAK58292.1 unnamed protein product [Paramecium tetraurelia]|eukprot:XP_001425690.1 hypothetical protein (macronuclear) [Paramecium tetraurelia strain d4-2]
MLNQLINFFHLRSMNDKIYIQLQMKNMIVQNYDNSYQQYYLQYLILIQFQINNYINPISLLSSFIQFCFTQELCNLNIYQQKSCHDAKDLKQLFQFQVMNAVVIELTFYQEALRIQKTQIWQVIIFKQLIFQFLIEYLFSILKRLACEYILFSFGEKLKYSCSSFSYSQLQPVYSIDTVFQINSQMILQILSIPIQNDQLKLKPNKSIIFIGFSSKIRLNQFNPSFQSTIQNKHFHFLIFLIFQSFIQRQIVTLNQKFSEEDFIQINLKVSLIDQIIELSLIWYLINIKNMFQNSTYLPQYLHSQGPHRQTQSILSRGGFEKRKAIDHYSYAIDQEIGKGFSSRVYKGRDERTLENVAVKVIDMKKLKQTIHKQLLKNEINALKSFNHQSILKLIDVCQTSNNTYIITEFCDSGDLDKYLRKNLKIKEPEAIRILQALVNAINEINLKGFIHRDIKPANILLKGNEPKLADFGFAVPVWQARIQQRNINVGTPLYMSPQALKHQDYSEKGDVWAVGIVYFEMLFGRTPFNAQSEAALLSNILNKSLIIPQTPSVSELSKDFIKKCLQIDDHERLNVKAMYEHQIIQSKNFYCYLQDDCFSQLKKINTLINNSQAKKSKRSLTQNLKRNCNQDQGNLENDVNEGNKKCYAQQDVPQRSSSQYQFQLPQYKIKHPLNIQAENTNSINLQQTLSLQQGDGYKTNNQILIFQINYCRYLFKFSQYLINSQAVQTEIKDKILFVLSKCIAVKISQLSKILDKENKGDNQNQLYDYDKQKQSQSFNGICLAVSEYQIKYMNHFQKILKLALKNNFSNDPIVGSLCNNYLYENNTVYEIALHYLNLSLNKLTQNLNQTTVDRYSDKTNAEVNIHQCQSQQLLFILEGLKNCKELIMMIWKCQYDLITFQKGYQIDRIIALIPGQVNHNQSENKIQYYS